MKIVAKKITFTPASAWVYAVIQTCDDKLAVWYKRRVQGVSTPTVCCLYPNVNGPVYYLSMVSHLSKGGFVWWWLPYHQPYGIVQPPTPPYGVCGIVTTCCPGGANKTLTVTVSGGGICDGGYTITYDPSITASPTWTGSSAVGTCPTGPLEFTCAFGNWVLTIGVAAVTASAVSCDPFVIVFTAVDLTHCGGGASATVTVTL